MAYMRRAVEGAAVLAMALALAGCETARVKAAREAPAEPPDGLDYIGAVQCGALASAEARFAWADEGSRADLRAGRFLGWAQIRARQAGSDPALAAKDIAVSEADIVAGLGEGRRGELRDRLRREHDAGFGYCNVLAKISDVIIVGG